MKIYLLPIIGRFLVFYLLHPTSPSPFCTGHFFNILPGSAPNGDGISIQSLSRIKERMLTNDYCLKRAIPQLETIGQGREPYAHEYGKGAVICRCLFLSGFIKSDQRSKSSSVGRWKKTGSTSSHSAHRSKQLHSEQKCLVLVIVN